MKALITGITGFIGSRLSTKLVNDGWVVAGLVRPSRNKESEYLYEYDGTFASVKKAIDLFNPQVIIHLATTYSSDTSSSVDGMASTNISLPLFLFEATKNISVKIVCAGSYWQFGSRGDFTPLDIYAASKTAADSLIEYYALRKNISTVILYFYGSYGSDDERGKILDYILQSIIDGKKIKLSPGNQSLNLVHVDDAVNAIQKIITNDDFVVGRVHKFGVYSDVTHTLKEIISICQENVGHQIDVEFGAIPYRERELMEPQYPYPTVPCWREKVNLKKFIKHILAKKK